VRAAAGGAPAASGGTEEASAGVTALTLATAGGCGRTTYAGAVADPTRDPERARPAAPEHRPAATAVITDARGAASAELAGRMRRYTITMAFRLACFLSMIFVSGWLRWVLLGAAVLLPYIAVVLANQSDQRTKTGTVEAGAPVDAPQITAGAAPAPGGEVIEGTVDESPSGGRQSGRADDEPRGRVA